MIGGASVGLDLESLLSLDDEKLYSIPDLEREYGLKKYTVYAWIRKGWIDAVRIGGRIYIPGKVLKAQIEYIHGRGGVPSRKKRKRRK